MWTARRSPTRHDHRRGRVNVLAVSAEGRNLLNNQRAASEGISSRTAAISFQVPSRCWRMESLDISEALARRGDGAKLRLPYRRADSCGRTGQKAPQRGQLGLRAGTRGSSARRLLLLRRLYVSKRKQQREVVGDLQHAADDERRSCKRCREQGDISALCRAVGCCTPAGTKRRSGAR